MFHPQDLQMSIQVLKYFLSAFAARITLQLKLEMSRDSQESPPSWRQEAAALPMAHDPAPKAQKAPARRRVQQGAWRVAGMPGLGPWARTQQQEASPCWCRQLLTGTRRGEITP